MPKTKILTNMPEDENKPQNTLYQLPLCGTILDKTEIWGDEEKPVLLRPKDLERYGIPEATVYDMVYKASQTKDPLPFLKLNRKILIPRVALEAWILRQAHVKELGDEKKAG